MLTDKMYNYYKNQLGENWYLIKEYQFFGFCPTWKNTQTNQVFYQPFGESSFLNKQELFNTLQENWQPASYEDRINFLNMKDIIFNNAQPYFE